MQKYGTGFFLKDLLPCYGYEVAPVATCSQRFRRPVAEPAQIPMKIHRLSAEVPHLSCWPAPRAANRWSKTTPNEDFASVCRRQRRSRVHGLRSPDAHAAGRGTNRIGEVADRRSPPAGLLAIALGGDRYPLRPDCRTLPAVTARPGANSTGHHGTGRSRKVDPSIVVVDAPLGAGGAGWAAALRSDLRALPDRRGKPVRLDEPQ